MIKRLSVVLGLGVGIWACTATKELTKPEEKIKNISDGRLANLLIDSSLVYNTIYLKKFDAEIRFSSNSHSFKGNLYIKKDSQIVVSVIPLMGIELYKLRFTPEKVEILDRVKKSYICMNYDVIAEKYDLDITFQMVEALLTNHAFSYISDGNGTKEDLKKFKNYIKENRYSFQSVKQRRINRLERKESAHLVYQEIVVLPERFRVKEVHIENMLQNQFLHVFYNDFKFFNGVWFPAIIEINGNRANSSFSSELNINNLLIDDGSKLSFTIPKNYKEVVSH